MSPQLTHKSGAQMHEHTGQCMSHGNGVQVLREFVGAYGPLAIMLEDLHHFDTTSWAFLTTVVENLSQQVLIVTTMRPNDGVLAATSQHEEGEAVPCCAVLC